MLFAIVIAIVLAGIFIVILKSQSSKNKAAAQWPTAQGRVLSAEIRQTRDSDGQASDEPAITYEYVAAGQTYRSNRVKFGFTPKTRPTLAKYPVGAVLQVFYNPANPSESVLER